jgi:hypothetical protein
MATEKNQLFFNNASYTLKINHMHLNIPTSAKKFQQAIFPFRTTA